MSEGAGTLALIRSRFTAGPLRDAAEAGWHLRDGSPKLAEICAAAAQVGEWDLMEAMRAAPPKGERAPMPTYPLPPGYVWAVAPETHKEWRIEPPDSGRKCRQPKCGERALVTLLRSHARCPSGYRWGCCAAHMYGRWVEGGLIVQWRAVPVVGLAGDQRFT